MGPAGPRGRIDHGAFRLRPHARRQGRRTASASTRTRCATRMRRGTASAVGITRKSRGYTFATTQHTQTMEERDPFRVGTFAEYHRDPRFARSRRPSCPDDHTLFPLWDYSKHKWGMSIDLTACVGCQACMVACQAENNIAVVGQGGSRQGPPHELDSRGPILRGPPGRSARCISSRCRACIVKTRCASWCVRSRRRCTAPKGLNEMVYNRCVGTRYCSNNCPYKVRRFNFFLYSDWYTQSLYGVRNPDVTVRSRGVMEKCSYCVQRINRAKIDAEKADRPVRTARSSPRASRLVPRRRSCSAI